jgi:hypothetical protein
MIDLRIGDKNFIHIAIDIGDEIFFIDSQPWYGATRRKPWLTLSFVSAVESAVCKTFVHLNRGFFHLICTNGLHFEKKSLYKWQSYPVKCPSYC